MQDTNEVIVKAGRYFAWSDSVMLAKEDCTVTLGSALGECEQVLDASMDLEIDEREELVKRVAELLNGDKPKCALCGEEDELSKCPCGKSVCGDCEDSELYSDETCCRECAEEIRNSWATCAKHEFEEPYENEEGDTIQECKFCSMPRIVASTNPQEASGKEK